MRKSDGSLEFYMIHGMLLARRHFATIFPLPLRERERVRGDKKNQAPSPHSSPLRQAQCGEPSRTTVKGEEVGGGRGILKLFLLFVLCVLLTPEQSHSQTKEKVRVALGSISVNTSVIPVGHQYGIFAKYGVDREPGRILRQQLSEEDRRKRLHKGIG
jgi:hypothetical protein